jgi:hypothetical protein
LEIKKKILSFFNFGESFQQWIKVFFTDITSCVLYTGWTTQYFSLSRGVRQIYQISPYLFLLCAEIVGIAIRQSKDIKGFCFKRKEIKLSQYADDTHILLDGSEKSVRNTVNLLNNLTKISRLRDNYNKSELASLGRSRMEIYTHNFSSGMKITVDKIKILGITIPTNGKYEDLIKLYYDEKRGKIKNIIQSWSKRSFSLFGKVTIIKSLIVPQLTHLLSVLPNPGQNYLTDIDSLIFNFLWDNTPPKLRGKTFYKRQIKEV